jgi:hypothetical protein
MNMEQTEYSETSVYKIQMPGNYPEENIQHAYHYYMPLVVLEEADKKLLCMYP